MLSYSCGHQTGGAGAANRHDLTTLGHPNPRRFKVFVELQDLNLSSIYLQ